MLEHFKRMLTAAAASPYVSTPNVLTLAPEGAEKSGNPWHVKEYRAEEFRALCAAHFADGRAATACSTRASCACTSSRSAHAALGRRPQARCGITKPLLRPLHAGDLASRDFALRGRRDRWTRALDFVAVCRP